MSHQVKLGVSLYSYCQQWIERSDFCFEDMLKHLYGLGIQTLEIVGAQMFSEYPIIPEQEVQELLSLAKKYSMSFFCYDGYTDKGKYSDRDLTEREIIQEIIYDIQSAKRLGCKMLKTHVPVELIEKVLPIAVEYDIKIGIEIHAPEQPGNANTQRYAATFKSLNTKQIGLVPDFGMFILRPNSILLDKYKTMGVKEELLRYIVENRFNGYNEDTMWQKIESMGGGINEKLAVSEMFGFLSWSKEADFEGLKSILPYCIYFHGKFYNIDESCVETTIPYRELLTIIAQSGFDGYIATEYEGHTFMLDDAFEQIERHILMEREILSHL